MSENAAAAPALPIVVLISGSGSNLQAIIDAIHNDALPVEIRAVISSHPGAYGLERARIAGIAAETLDHTRFTSRAAYEAALQRLIDRHHPALVVLAGYMRILGKEFVDHYAGRMLNVHPSLLPAFPGLNTHQRALEASVSEHGASIHFVTNELDGGPVIIQATVPVLPTDNPATLAQRVHTQEHLIYPLAIRWFAEERLTMQHGKVFLDRKAVTDPIRFEQSDNP